PDEQKAVYADYGKLNRAPGLTPGLPLGLPADATTVRVRSGSTVKSDGPFLGAHGSIAGTMGCEADDLDAAIALAAQVPAAPLRPARRRDRDPSGRDLLVSPAATGEGIATLRR